MLAARSIAEARLRRHLIACKAKRAAVSAMLLTACGPQQETVRTEVVTVHGTMLTLEVPDALAASSIAGGLMLRPRDARLKRSIYEMTITLGDTADRGTTPRLNRVRGTGAEAIRYGVRRDEGGSGGEEMTLLATRPCAQTTVRLRFDTQAEADEAIDMAPAFAVMDSARCASAD